jgi:hypothetical protein
MMVGVLILVVVVVVVMMMSSLICSVAGFAFVVTES